MPQFIRSADRKFIINVSNVHRIYEVINPNILNFVSIFFGCGQESGIYCETVGKDGRLHSYPLVTLTDAKCLVKFYHPPTKSKQYIKALSCRLSHFELFRSLLDQVEHSLFNNMKIIDMSSLIEQAIHWHVQRIVGNEIFCDHSESNTQRESGACR